MTDRKDDAARRKKTFLEEWLRRDDQQRDLRPHVVNLLGTAAWEVDAMDAVRAESPEMAGELNAEIGHELDRLKETLPLPVEYDAEVSASTTSAVTVSSNTRIFEALVALRPEDFITTSPLQTQIVRYEALVAEQHRVEETARRLARLFPDLSARFAEVRVAVLSANGDAPAEEAAAFAMRTFLDKLKGELFNKARKNVAENMTWQRMAERLTPTPTLATVFLEQEQARSGLITSLSDIGKARTSSYTFEEVWTRFVDHVFVVCGLVLSVPSR